MYIINVHLYWLKQLTYWKIRCDHGDSCRNCFHALCIVLSITLTPNLLLGALQLVNLVVTTLIGFIELLITRRLCSQRCA